MMCELLRFFFVGKFGLFFLLGILKSRSEFTFDRGIHRGSIDFLHAAQSACCVYT